MKESKIKKGWLLLMHQLPPQPDAFRVKVWRKLQRTGAIALKNSVYVLPHNDKHCILLKEIVDEIQSNSGDAFLCDADFLEGIGANEIKQQFNAERDKSFLKITEELEPLLALFKSKTPPGAEKLMKIEHSLGKLRRQFEEIVSIDFFSSKVRIRTEKILSELEKKVSQVRSGIKIQPLERKSIKDFQGRTWVTRQNLYVDRLASAWLIQRFIDKNPHFKFINLDQYSPSRNDIRFDMFDGEFTHHGDLCTFETLIEAFQLEEQALIPIAEIIHDIDLKDCKYNREEKSGIEIIIDGIAHSEKTDKNRLERAITLFDELYARFKAKIKG